MAPLDASSGTGEARLVSNALRKGVRMELVVAPISFLVPLLVAALFWDLGLRHGSPAYLALGAVVFLGNVVFDYLMVRNALRFLMRARSGASTREPPPAK